jgi:class 3 adenylate cyclase
MPDSLDQTVEATVQGSYLGKFLTELFQGISQLALFLLLLEIIWDWGAVLNKPDIYVLSAVTLAQSAWLARRQFIGLGNPWWTRLIGLLCYAVIESMIEGPGFFAKPKHQIFILLTLIFVLGRELERRKSLPWLVTLGTVLARSAQGIGPLLFYIALDLRDLSWDEEFNDFFQSPGHIFLLVFCVTQIGSLISLTLIARHHRTLIGDLLKQLKTLSRWGFGRQIVEDVLRDSGTHAAARVERAIGFIDIRGFTAWSETHPPEEVMALLNSFYAAILEVAAVEMVKSKSSGDEVLLVLHADAQAVPQMQIALRAAIAAIKPLQLSAGAGLWVGPVVEGFFGPPEAQVHDVIGDTVNTAKRLCDNAQRGQLLAGPPNRLGTSTQQRISIKAKGKTKPVVAAIYTV